MNIEQAKSALQGTGRRSVDYYLTEKLGALLLMPSDSPSDIFYDLCKFGNEEQRKRVEQGISLGWIIVTNLERAQIAIKCLDSDQPSHDLEYSCHFLLQLAFPAPYIEVLGQQFFDKPSYQKLVEYCWKKYSDDTQINLQKRKPGRPRGKDTPAKQPTKPGFKEWTAACRAYNETLSKLWSQYLEACQERKDRLAWLDEQISLIKEEAQQRINDFMREFKDENHQLNINVQGAYDEHKELKEQGKPKREDFC